MNREKINKLLNQIPTHVIVILTMIIWIVPTLGLLVTSLRPPEAVRSSGWWTVFGAQTVGGPYAQYCAGCHGADGAAILQADGRTFEAVSLERLPKPEEPSGPSQAPRSATRAARSKRGATRRV